MQRVLDVCNVCIRMFSLIERVPLLECQVCSASYLKREHILYRVCLRYFKRNKRSQEEEEEEEEEEDLFVFNDTLVERPRVPAV